MLPGLDATTKRLLLSAGTRGGSLEVTTATGPERRTTTVTVAPDSTTVVDLARADRVWVVARGAGDVRAAVSVVGDDAGVPRVAAVPLTDAPVTSLVVPVRQVGS